MSQNKPTRIISLVPSQTELLYDLGLRDEVIGITKFCIHPDEWFRRKQRVGGTKNLKIDLIKSLNPDLILANKEENLKEEIEILQNDFNVYVSDISTINEALQMIEDIGKLVHCQQKSIEIVNGIKAEMMTQSRFEKKDKIDALYLIWQNPYMVAGNNTFIHDMMLEAGFNNLVKQNRYPMMTLEEIKSINPTVIMLSSEPFPFADKHIIEWQMQLPNTKIILVDGELFSWYGSRMLKSFQYFRGLYEELSS
jgi:ABC-type Fe3+-hydroxamate transport system substrate-binding protein